MKNGVKEKNKIISEQLAYKPKITKEEEIKRMKLIFKTYARRSGENAKFFSDLKGLEDRLNGESFIKFVKEFHLNRILKL